MHHLEDEGATDKVYEMNMVSMKCNLLSISKDVQLSKIPDGSELTLAAAYIWDRNSSARLNCATNL